MAAVSAPGRESASTYRSMSSSPNVPGRTGSLRRTYRTRAKPPARRTPSGSPGSRGGRGPRGAGRCRLGGGGGPARGGWGGGPAGGGGAGPENPPREAGELGEE